MSPAQIAQVCHETNRAYCRVTGDDSQPAWDDAPDWQRRSAAHGVQFHLENPDADQRRSHEEWLKCKSEEGWNYGPVKDPIAKKHPCFLPYDGLPVEQRAKDALFKAVVDALRPLATIPVASPHPA